MEKKKLSFNPIKVSINALTMARLIAAFSILYITNAFGILPAGIIFGVASITDGIDGLVARKTRNTTFFGKILDAFADKVLNISGCLTLCLNNSWAYASIAVFEGLIFAKSKEALEKNKNIQSSIMGKVKTAVVFSLLTLSMILPETYEISKRTMTLIALIPSLITQALTLKSYQKVIDEDPITELSLDESSEELDREIEEIKNNLSKLASEKGYYKELKGLGKIWSQLFDTPFHEEHENSPKLDLLHEFVSSQDSKPLEVSEMIEHILTERKKEEQNKLVMTPITFKNEEQASE